MRHLIKKDFMLIRNYWIFTVILIFGIPLFLQWQKPDMMGFAAFMTMVIFSVYTPLQSVAIAEAKDPKAIAFLCATPYTRSDVVKARYAFLLVLFIFCCFAYTILSLLVPQIETIRLFDIVLGLLILTIIFGVYMPLQYKLGYEKMKYVLMFILFATAFLVPSIIKIIVKAGIGLSIFNELPLMVSQAGFVTMIFIVASLSLTISINTFQRKEL